ncbi:DUF1109 domain-containing protein [uncultured Brevundimonas sp.]|uniref:DUF1109 domain-containing protein n=1 Tax=uncultured Brevundimonas sp. TaxID=213418 RepID=UPI0030EC8DAA
MNTDDLIEALAGDARRVPAGRAGWRLVCCTGMALAAAVAVVWLTLGFRPDLGAVVDGVSFLMRQAYTLSIAGFGALLLLRLGQPGAPLRLPLAGLAVTVAVILIAVVVEQSALSGPARIDAWLGQSWQSCTLRVAAISLVATPFIFFAARRLAPTRPTTAGFVAGLVAGAVAASAYGLFCSEETVSFMAGWYSLGMLTAGAIGAGAGRFLLRW